MDKNNPKTKANCGFGRDRKWAYTWGALGIPGAALCVLLGAVLTNYLFVPYSAYQGGMVESAYWTPDTIFLACALVALSALCLLLQPNLLITVIVGATLGTVVVGRRYHQQYSLSANEYFCAFLSSATYVGLFCLSAAGWKATKEWREARAMRIRISGYICLVLGVSAAFAAYAAYTFTEGDFRDRAAETIWPLVTALVFL